MVAFPQDGIYTFPDGSGISGAPWRLAATAWVPFRHNELTREDGVRSVELASDLAEKFGRMVDIHCDETGDEQSRFVEVMARCAISMGMGERTAASHTTAMHNYGNDYALKLMGIFQRAGKDELHHPPLRQLGAPEQDGRLSPAERTHPGGRTGQGGSERVHRSRLHNGSVVSRGKGSMLAAANLLLHTAHMSGYSQVFRLFRMITGNSAETPWVSRQLRDRPEKMRASSCSTRKMNLTPFVCRVNVSGRVRRGRIVSQSVPATRTVTRESGRRDVDFKWKRMTGKA